jgi:hypothetical protein
MFDELNYKDFYGLIWEIWKDNGYRILGWVVEELNMHCGWLALYRTAAILIICLGRALSSHSQAWMPRIP